ncbi:hypothetical protein KPA97_67195, partial [Burkholderia cenocepacia]|nr:hypothetical protein [Burkholderia cenocepacia]
MLLIQSELTERREPIPQILRIMGGSCREKIDKQARLCAVLTIQKMGRVWKISPVSLIVRRTVPSDRYVPRSGRYGNSNENERDSKVT